MRFIRRKLLLLVEKRKKKFHLLCLNHLRSNQKAFIESADVLQIIIAYCQISDTKGPKCQEFDKLSTYVKVLTQNMLDKDGPSVLSRLYALFSEEFERNDKSLNYMPSDLIILLIYVYSLIGEECYFGVEEEKRIKVKIQHHYDTILFLVFQFASIKWTFF